MVEISLCLSNQNWASFPAHTPRDPSSLLHLLLWTTRDLLPKIAKKKNTFHHPSYLGKCQSYLPTTLWPFWTRTQLSTEEQKTRKSLCVWPDRRQIVTSLQVENRSPTSQKGTGPFPLLSPRPPAVTWNAKCTEHLMEWNARQGHDDSDSVRLHEKVLSFHRDRKPQEGQEGPTQCFFPRQQLVQWPHFTNEQTHSPCRFQHVAPSERQIQDPVLKLDIWE